MATLYITEFAEIQGGDNNGKVPVVKLPPLAEQTVAIGAETDSAAFNAATKFIRVHCDAICSIKVAATGNPAATTSSMRLPADHTEYFAVDAGGKLSVISNT